MNAGIVVAVEKASKVGTSLDCAFLTLGSRPVLAHALMAYERCTRIDFVAVVVRRERMAAVKGLAKVFGCSKVQLILPAVGSSRTKSVLGVLREMDADVRLVSVHEGTRPCIDADLVAATLAVAEREGAAVAARKLTDVLRIVGRGNTVTQSLTEAGVWSVQSPQSFQRLVLLSALEAQERGKAMAADDECEAVLQAGGTVHVVPGPLANIRIEKPDDLTLAAELMRL